MATYRVFYNIIRLGSIAADDAVEMELADVYSEVFPLLKEDREFVGLFDAGDRTLQAMYDEENDEYWFEIPRPDLEGSYAKILSFDSAVDLIKALGGTFPDDGFEGFEFQPWRSS